jgi:hypothetical protein
MKTTKKNIPYDFVIEALESLNPYVKAMFGAYAVYVEDKLIFILRQKDSYLNDNGIWLATFPEHHESLRKLFPQMRSLELFQTDYGTTKVTPNTAPTAWQNIPENEDNFEESALLACELVLKGDPRIGKIPQRRLKKANGKTKIKARTTRKSTSKSSQQALTKKKKLNTTKTKPKKKQSATTRKEQKSTR